jgi:hypothetical protein
MTASPRLSYFGVQVALAFYLVRLQELLPQCQVLQHEVFAGSKRADKPADEVPKHRNHGKDLSGRPVPDFAPSSSFHGPLEFWRTTALNELMKSTFSTATCHIKSNRRELLSFTHARTIAICESRADAVAFDLLVKSGFSAYDAWDPKPNAVSGSHFARFEPKMGLYWKELQCRW